MPILNKLLKIKILRFAIVGGTGSVIKLSILYLFTDIVGLTPAISYFIAFIIVVSSNYLFNTIWTFKDKLGSIALVKYATISLITLSINEGMLYFLTYRLGVWYIFSGMVGILIAFVINYTLARRYVWKQKQELTAEQALKRLAYWQ